MDLLASPISESAYEKLEKELLGKDIVTLAFDFETSTGFVLYEEEEAYARVGCTKGTDTLLQAGEEETALLTEARTSSASSPMPQSVQSKKGECLMN